MRTINLLLTVVVLFGTVMISLNSFQVLCLENCPNTITREYLIGKNFTTILNGFNPAKDPSNFNQMHMFFNDKYVHAQIVDFNYAGIRDLVIEFIEPYTILDDTRIILGDHSIAPCYQYFGRFTSPEDKNSACLKWARFFRSDLSTSQNVFQIQLTNNCTQLSLKNSALDVTFEESQRFPAEFCDQFIEKKDWFVTQDVQHKFYVKFSETKILSRFNFGQFELVIENIDGVSQCNGSQSLVVGSFEIFSNFSLINSDVTSCINTNDKCNMCNEQKLKNILFGELTRDAECTKFSVSNAQNFVINGQSPTPFNPNNSDKIGIIVGATIGGLFVVLCFSASIIGLVYMLKRKKQYASLH